MTGLPGAARSLLRSPGFSVLTIGTLALGIGTATAMSTVVHQVLLRPLPVTDQERVVVAWGDHRVRDFPHYPLLWDAWLRLRDDARTLAGVAATDAGGAVELLLEDEGGVAPLRVGRTVGDFFGVLGVTPLLGRALRVEDEAPGAARVLVVSHGLWMGRWGGDPAVVGSSLVLAGETFQVVGVLPEAFDYPRGSEVWAPALPFRPRIGDSDDPYLELDLVGRLAEGATPAEAALELERLLGEDPEIAGTYRDVALVVRALPDVLLGELGPTLLLLFGGAWLVLGVSLFNVANLILVRVAGREGAWAVRRALGADGLRLARDALAEGALLGALSGVLGGALAAVSLRWVLPLVPAGLPRLEHVRVDGSFLALLAGLTALLVTLLGVLPVLGARAVEPAAALRSSRGTPGGRGVARRGLLAAQTALALWAVAAALLMVRTLRNLQALDLGFAAEDVLVVQLEHGYGVGQVPEAYVAALEAIVARLEAHPAIVAATPVIAPPLAASSLDAALGLEGQSAEEARANPYLNAELVLPGYFGALDVPLLKGRTFAGGVDAQAPGEVVVNAAAAGALWPGEDAVGKRVRGFGAGGEERWWTVVGVVADMRYRDLLEPRLSVYFPLRQLPLVPPRSLLVRTRTAGAGAPELLPLVASAFAEADPAVRVVGASSLLRRLEAPLARPRLSLAVLGAFACVVLVLAGVGVYGVMAASVRSRMGEMGVRLACGAGPAEVGGLVVRQGMAYAALGALAGTGAALATSRLLGSLLFDVSPADPASLLGAAALVLGVAAGACVPPALRAARTDPAVVLRRE